MKSNRLKTILLSAFAIFVLVVSVNTFNPPKASSKSAEEIQKELDKKNAELQKTAKDIAKIQAAIKNASKELAKSSEGLPELEQEIKKLDLEIKLYQNKLKKTQQEKELKDVLVEKLNYERLESVGESYKTWRTNADPNTEILDDVTSFQKFQFYETLILANVGDAISKYALEISGLEQTIKDSTTDVNGLNAKIKELNKKREAIVAEINQINSVIATNSVQKDKLSNQQAQIANNISALLKEQQEAARKEAEKISNPKPPTNPDPVPVEGAFYFGGIGRDLYQGHGVGMSQWGAYGAAKRGWSASKIVTFYYSNTSIKTIPGKKISVQGYGTMDINTYAAGLGEVPSKACGNKEQASARPDKYVIDNAFTVWDCWPEEAIKAQVIAARSYGIRQSQPICTTASCQVYAGHKDKKWAADETKDMFIVSNGSSDNGNVISALYSSDNSQGSGTANNDTIFQSFNGTGWPNSYLRAKNDSSIAEKTQWTNWGYSTKKYNLKSIYDMFKFVAFDKKSVVSDSLRNDVKNLINGVSSFTAISFSRDPSGRVVKVNLTVNNGSTRVIGGWWFKNVWNNWTYDSGRYDYLYSQTFYLKK